MTGCTPPPPPPQSISTTSSCSLHLGNAGLSRRKEPARKYQTASLAVTFLHQGLGASSVPLNDVAAIAISLYSEGNAPPPPPASQAGD